MKTLPWLLRRELWENRFLYIVPLVFLGLLTVSYTWTLLSHGLSGSIEFQSDGGAGVVNLQSLLQGGPEARQGLKLAAGSLPFIVPAVLLNAVMLFVWFFYLSDSLYTERKDRSVLFWKSLPVTDASTVLSKLLMAMAVIPAVTFAGIMLAAFAMTLANTVFVWSMGESAWQLIWSQVPFISGPVTLLYALAVQSLWYAPLFGWLMLASAWARRAPALWALLPPAGIGFLEAATLRTTNFGNLMAERLTPIVPTAFHDEDFSDVMDKVHSSSGKIEWSEAFASLINPGAFLSDSALWGGLVVAALFVIGAIGLRRYRVEL